MKDLLKNLEKIKERDDKILFLLDYLGVLSTSTLSVLLGLSRAKLCKRVNSLQKRKLIKRMTRQKVSFYKKGT